MTLTHTHTHTEGDGDEGCSARRQVWPPLFLWSINCCYFWPVLRYPAAFLQDDQYTFRWIFLFNSQKVYAEEESYQLT